MKKILVVGYFGFENFGDEWLLVNLIKLIKKFSTTKKKIYVLYNIRKYRKIEDICYIPRWNFFCILNVLTKIDTVIYCGGLFQDHTSIFSFLYYLFIFLFAKLLFKKIVLLNTEFSFKKFPFFITKFLCFNSDKVILRNKLETDRVLKYYKNKNKILFCPDICYIDSNEESMQVNDFKKDFKKVALIIKSEKKEKFLLVNFCVKLIEKYKCKLVFIPLHLREDYRFCLEIAKQLKNCEIRVWDKLENYRFMLKDIDLVVVSRLHGIIMSSNLNIPFICFSEQTKIRNLVVSNYEAQCFLLNDLETQKLEEYIIYPKSNKNFFHKNIEMTFNNLTKLGYI